MTLTQYQQDVENNTQGLTAISTGICPGCEQCRDDYADGCDMESFEELWSSGKVHCDPYFSWHGCELCGNTLGNSYEPWHAIDQNGELIHGEYACEDCVQYLANGILPEED